MLLMILILFEGCQANTSPESSNTQSNDFASSNTMVSSTEEEKALKVESELQDSIRKVNRVNIDAFQSFIRLLGVVKNDDQLFHAKLDGTKIGEFKAEMSGGNVCGYMYYEIPRESGAIIDLVQTYSDLTAKADEQFNGHVKLDSAGINVLNEIARISKAPRSMDDLWNHKISGSKGKRVREINSNIISGDEKIFVSQKYNLTKGACVVSLKMTAASDHYYLVLAPYKVDG